MIHLGDITKINGAKAPAVEVVIGGSPCQDLSVAGKRAGLAGERSGLFMEQIRIIKEMRRESERSGADVVIPRFMVWENVPGAFSSNSGEDFRTVLEETARVADASASIPRPCESWTNAGAVMGNGWSIAWRVLDAQFWGVPQRRRRIALVADFGGYAAPEVLFERNSLSGNTPPSGTPWKDFAAAIAERSGVSNSKKRTIGGPGPHQPTYCIQGNCVDRPDTANCNGKGWTEGVGYTLNTVDRHVVFNGETITNKTNQSNPKIGDPCHTLSTRGAGRSICVQGNADYSAGFNGWKSKSGSIQYQKGLCPTIEANMPPNVITLDRAAFNQGINARYDMEITEDGINSTLTARGPSAVCAGFKAKIGAKAHGIGYESETAPTLSADQQDAAVVTVADVRRLTPLECERLQGYPDDWTDIGSYIDTNGKKRTASDSARYKALGNSIALPPWAWILERLSFYCKTRTMASLFDGIGGFPLIWETLNGEGSCLWASEIEEFAVAVTKRRFNFVRSQQIV